MNQLKNMKFRRDSPEHSKHIQRELFRLGYKTYSGVFLDFRIPFLECDSDGLIGCIFTQSSFDCNPYTETTLEELKLM